jgi:hypothetical protein
MREITAAEFDRKEVVIDEYETIDKVIRISSFVQ